MEKWPVIGVASGVAVAIAVQELLHQGVKPHTLHDIELLDSPIGRVAIEAVTSGAPLQVKAFESVLVDDGGMRLVGIK